MCDGVDGKIKLCVFLGSVRDERNTDRVWQYAKQFFELQQLFDISVIDPLESVEIRELCHPLHYTPEGKPKCPKLSAINEIIVAANAFLVICGTYNQSLPGIVTTMLGNFPPASYAHKPVGMICYSSGFEAGIPSVIQLRSLMCKLGCVVCPTSVHIARVTERLDKNGALLGRPIQKLDELIGQLIWYTQAFGYMKELVGLPQPARMS